jgi:hypothetical protein
MLPACHRKKTVPVNIVTSQRAARGAGRPSSGSVSTAIPTQLAEAGMERAKLCRGQPNRNSADSAEWKTLS